VPDARAALRAVGFKVSVVDEETDDPTLDGVVIFQDPGGSTQAEPGTRVTLTVGRYVAPPETTPTEPIETETTPTEPIETEPPPTETTPIVP
ncbi:MAG: PASTA domain-containing protein, partial [Gaiella sp.]